MITSTVSFIGCWCLCGIILFGYLFVCCKANFLETYIFFFPEFITYFARIHAGSFAEW